MSETYRRDHDHVGRAVKAEAGPADPLKMQPRAGGQAVFEGVMMRVDDRWAVAARTREGGIDVHAETVTVRAPRARSWPLLRGVLSLAEALPLGMRAMRWAVVRVAPAASERARSRWVERLLTVAIVGAVLAAFVVGPGLVALAAAPGSAVAFNVVEGAVRLAMLVGYLAALARLPEVRRLFEYHGAEHKVVAAYEAGAPLTPASAARFTTRHVRCGTSFLLLVAVVSTAVHVLMGRPDTGLLIASRVLLVPVVAALAAELQRLAADNQHRRWVRAAMRPGLALQGLTTREPTMPQLEVAIAALKAALPQQVVAEVEAREARPLVAA